MKEFKRVMAGRIIRRDIKPFLGIPPYIYEFATFAWDILNENTRAQAKERIMADLERQVDEKLDDHVRIAAKKQYLTKSPEIREKDHFRWLVLYQIEGLSYTEVTRKVHPQHSISGSNKGKSLKDPAAFLSDKAAVTNGIKTAAKHLIDPGFIGWLRPGKPGPPRKAQ